MPYTCMCFGWYQELLREARAEDLVDAEAKLLDMLNGGGMIVHVYRDTEPENPELVGRHQRFRSFVSSEESDNITPRTELPHEVERFLLDHAALDAWNKARGTDALLDDRWSVVELWSSYDQETPAIYGKATLITPHPGAICADGSLATDPLPREHNQR